MSGLIGLLSFNPDGAGARVATSLQRRNRSASVVTLPLARETDLKMLEKSLSDAAVIIVVAPISQAEAVAIGYALAESTQVILVGVAGEGLDEPFCRSPIFHRVDSLDAAEVHAIEILNRVEATRGELRTLRPAT